MKIQKINQSTITAEDIKAYKEAISTKFNESLLVLPYSRLLYFFIKLFKSSFV